MDDFHCDSFEMRIRFQPHEMNVEAFLKALPELGIEAEEDDDGDTDVFTVFSASETSDANYHAHLSVDVKKNGGGDINLTYYSGSKSRTDSSLNAETCAQWLADFFIEKTITTHLHINYAFGKSFATVIALPFPYITSEAALAGATVSGLALTLPKDNKGAIIQRSDDQTYLFLREGAQMDLQQFNLLGELNRLATSVSMFVKENL